MEGELASLGKRCGELLRMEVELTTELSETKEVVERLMAAQKVKDDKMNWLAAQMESKVRIQEGIVTVLKEENDKLQQRVAQLEKELREANKGIYTREQLLLADNDYNYCGGGSEGAYDDEFTDGCFDQSWDNAGFRM